MSARRMRNKWWVDFRYQYTRYRRKSPLNTRVGALNYEATLRKRLSAGEPVDGPEPAVAITFAEFAAEWFKTYVVANNKPSERYAKASILRTRLLPFFGTMELRQLSVDRVERFKADALGRGLSPKTVNNTLAVLRKCLMCAMEWERVPAVPRIRPLKAPPPAIDYLSEEEADRLRAFACDHPERYGMVLAALDTGMRLGELRALRWDDIDFESGVIVVSRSFARAVELSTKSNRIRSLPMTDHLHSVLTSLPRRSDRVFQGTGGAAITEEVATTLVRRACVEAGVRSGAWHRLRHTFATRAVRRGNSIRAVQTLLGHSTITMTERYTHVAPGHEREVIRSLDAPLPTAAVGNRWATPRRNRKTVDSLAN